MCLFMKHNPMGINRNLYFLEKLTPQKGSLRETQEILWTFSKIAICRTQHLGCILEINLQ